MMQLETGEESVAFGRALEHLTEGGWSFEDDEDGGNRRAFEIVFCAGRDYARLAASEAAPAASEARLARLTETLTYYADPDHWRGFFWPVCEDRGARARLAVAAEGGQTLAATVHALTGGQMFPVSFRAALAEAPEQRGGGGIER